MFAGALLYCLQALHFLRFPWNRSRQSPTTAANVHAHHVRSFGIFVTREVLRHNADGE
jgi:hypothetical protein